MSIFHITCSIKVKLIGLSTRNHFIAKDVKNCFYCYGVRYSTLIVRIGEMPWPKTGATDYHAKLGLLRQKSWNQRVCCLMGVT